MAEAVVVKVKAKAKAKVKAVQALPAKPLINFGKQTITITYGECAENHAGMQKLGAIAKRGLTLADLKAVEAYFQSQGKVTELIMLGKDLDVSSDACILIVRGGASNADDLYREQADLRPDTKAKMRGRVVNKHARYNLCFDTEAQEPDYEEGKGRIVPFSEVPHTEALRQDIMKMLPHLPELKAEGNYYYDVTKCGIGYHGDSERKIVIAVRLGHSMTLHYWWYHRFERVGDRIDLELHHGDMYFMSEKATGFDWKRSSIYTLRHAAGCSKYTD